MRNLYKLTFLLALSALTLVSCSKGNNDKSEESSTSNGTYQYSAPSGYGNYNSLLSDAYEDDEYAEDEDDAEEEYADDEDSEYWDDEDLDEYEAYGDLFDDDEESDVSYGSVGKRRRYSSAGTTTIMTSDGIYQATTDAYGNTTGFDANGNYYSLHTDAYGNTTGFDGNGNYVHSHTDDYGNTTGFDGNGNYYHYHTDDYGNTTGFDGDGNYVSGYTDNFGNTTINVY